MPVLTTKPVFAPVQRIVDLTFGYDFFISYSWSDGREYATRLADVLRAEGYVCFLDSTDFPRGANWRAAGRQALRKSGALLLVVTPLAIQSVPVSEEVQFFRTLGRAVIPITIGGVLAAAQVGGALRGLIASDDLRIEEGREAIADGPGAGTVSEIRRSFHLVRQGTRRLRIATVVSAALAALAVASLALALYANARRINAIENADAGILLQSDLALRIDPTLAAATLRGLSPRADALRTWTLLADITREPLSNLVLTGHEASIVSLAFSPDGSVLASGGFDSEVRLWNLHTGKVLTGPTMKHDTKLFGCVFAVEFSPDGAVLASGGEDGAVRLWDARTRLPLFPPLRGHDDGSVNPTVTALAFSPNEPLIASAGNGQRVVLWDYLRGVVSGPPLEGHDGDTTSLAFTPDGKWLAVGDHAGNIRIWNVAKRSLARLLVEKKGAEVSNLFYIQDGRRLVSIAEDVSIWNLEGPPGRPDTVVASEARPRGGAIDPGGAAIAVGSEDGSVGVWNLVSRTLVAPAYRGHRGWVGALRFSPDGRRLATAGFDKRIRVWNVGVSDSVATVASDLGRHEDASGFQLVAFSPSGGRLALASLSHQLRLWENLSGGPGSGASSVVDLALTDAAGIVSAMVFSADGTRIATGDSRGVVRILPCGRPGRASVTVPNGDSRIEAIALSSDGSLLIAADNGPRVNAWNVATRTKRQELKKVHEGRTTALAFSPDGNLLVSGGEDGTIGLWQSKGLAFLRHCAHAHRGAVRALSFSPSGHLLASASDDGTILLWNPATCEAVGGPMRGHGDGSQTITVWDLFEGTRAKGRNVGSISFSPDGTILASGGYDYTVRLWDVRTQRQIGKPLARHTEYVDSVSFSSDGRLLASVGEDNQLILWDMSLATIPAVKEYIDRRVRADVDALVDPN